MKYRKRIIESFPLGMMALTLLLSTLTPHQSVRASTLAPVEADFVTLLNRFRQKLGLQTLEIHPALQRAARKHSAWMAEQDRTFQDGDQLGHEGPGETDTMVTRILDHEGYAFRRVGENIACGIADAKTVFKMWALSPSHLTNMMNPHFREMGIAREGTGNEACPYYWTNDFGTRIQEKPDSAIKPTPQQIRHAIDGSINATESVTEESKTS